VGQFLDHWLSSQRSIVKPSTYYTYNYRCRKHLIPALGSLKLSEVSCSVLSSYFLGVTGSPWFVRSLKTTLSTALESAHLPQNPCQGASTPRLKKSQFQTWTADQCRTFLEGTKDHRLWMVFRLALSTGMRIGEILALRWSDIDWDRSLIQVRRTLARTETGQWHETEPKTRSSIRTVSLSTAVRQDLMTLTQDRSSSYHLIFQSTRRSQYCTEVGISYILTVRSSSLGLPRLRTHDLRHTAATLMFQMGVHPKVVQEQLGHSSISTTLDLYSHVIEGMHRDAAERLDGLFQTPPDEREL
jgi:integrase